MSLPTGRLGTTRSVLGRMILGAEGPVVPAPLKLLREDPMTDENVEDVWGLIQAAKPARYELIKETKEGSPWTKGNGEPQDNGNFRRLQIVEGDRFDGTERTELGANESRYGTSGGKGTFWLYQESTTIIVTFFDLRPAENFPASNENWQNVMQMKETQPYEKVGPYGLVIYHMELRENEWQIIVPPKAEEEPLFTAPAAVNQWTRFRIENVYSTSSKLGSTNIQIDDRTGLPANSPFKAQHSSGTIPRETLSYADGKQEGYENLAPVPSHLRLGIYRNPVIKTSTHIDIDNVQIYEVT